MEAELHKSSRWTVVRPVCRLYRPGIKFQGLDFDVQNQHVRDYKHQLKFPLGSSLEDVCDPLQLQSPVPTLGVAFCVLHQFIRRKKKTDFFN